MARQYSPKTFLRKAPNKLLKEYLAKHNVGTDLQWEHLAEARDGRPRSHPRSRQGSG